jgi:tetratricopeptide (TPR) repeat protein
MLGFQLVNIMKSREWLMLCLCCVVIVNFVACGKSQGEKERDNYFMSQCKNVDSIWNYYAVEHDPEEYISIICNAQGNLGRMGLKDSALKLIYLMDQYAMEANNPKVFTYVYLNRAFDALVNGRVDSALIFYNKRNKYISSADDVNITMAYQLSGNCYYMLGEIDSARRAFVNGYNFARDRGDSVMMYTYALNAGTTYFDLQLMSMAKYYFYEAYVLGSKKEKVSLMLINNLVATLITENKYQEAVKLCEENQSKWMTDTTDNGSVLLRLNYAFLLNKQGEYKRADKILNNLSISTIPVIHMSYYYANLLESMYQLNKIDDFKSTLNTLSPFIYQNQPRSVTEMQSILTKAIDKKLYYPNLDSLIYKYNVDLKTSTDISSSVIYCEMISHIVKGRGDKTGAEIWSNRGIKHQLELSQLKDSLQGKDIENEIAQAELNYKISEKQNIINQSSTKNKLVLIGLLCALITMVALLIVLRLRLRNRKNSTQILELEKTMKVNEILALKKEKELKEKTIILAQSVLVQVSKLSENIRNSSFSKDPQVLLLKQDLDRLSELSTSFSELDIQNDVAYSEFDYLFDKIPSLAPLNQTERKILILTIMGSRPKEIGSILILNDQYVRNVKSKIKKLLPEEMQNVEWDQLRKFK